MSYLTAKGHAPIDACPFAFLQDGLWFAFYFFLADYLIHIAQSWIQSPVTDMVPPSALA
jgi:hypothetical protein